MATTVGEILVDIRAKFDKLQSDMDGAKGTVSRAGKDIKSVATSIQGALIAVGTGAFAQYIKGAIDAAGVLADLSQKTGISARELSALDYAAKMSGTNIEGVATGLRGLSKNMVEAAGGTGDAADAFKALGINVTDSSGKLKSSNAVMLEVADKFAGMENGAEKTALAMKVFGKSGTDLIPMLNEGSAGIQKLKQDAEDLGLVMSDETAAAMESLGDKFDSVGMASTGLARQFAANITPALTAVADSLLEGAKQGGILKGAIEVLGDAFRVLVSAGFVVVEGLTRIGKTLGALGAAAVSFFKGDFGAAADIMRDHQKDMLQRNEDFSVKMGAVWSKEIKAQESVAKATDINIVSKNKLSEAASKAAEKIATVIGKLEDEIRMLGMSSVEAEIYKKQKEANVSASSEEGQAIATLVTQLDAEKERRKLAKEGMEASAKAYKDLETARQGELNKLIESIDAENRRIATLGMSKSQVAELTLAEMERRREMIAAEPYMEAELESMDRRIEKQKELIGILKNGELADANNKAAEDAQKAWEKTAESIENALTDSLMRGFESGKSMVQSLKDYIVNAFKSFVVKFGVQAIMGMLGMGGAGGSMASTLSGAGNAVSSLSNMLSGGSSLWNTLQGGFTSLGNNVAFGADAIGNWLVNNTTGSLNSLGGSLMGNAGMIGTIGSYAGGIGAGMGIGNMISGQYSLGGNKNIATGIGTAIGAAVAGPLGAAIGGAIGGLVNRAFGRGPKEVQERGVTGSFGAGNFSGQSYQDWKQKGGWFRSDKSGTDLSALPTEVEQLMDKGAGALLDSVTSLAKALNLPADQIGNITTSIRVRLTGNAAEDEAAITAALTQYESALTAQFADALAPFQKAGETLTQTMQRLVVIQAFTETINQFGGIFSAIAGSSIEARESLIAMSGGIEALISKAQAFVQAYYTSDEQTGMMARSVSNALQAVGIDTDALTSKGDFRALLESLNPEIEAQRQQIAALLEVAPAFAQIAASLGNGQSLADIAANAPVIAALEPMFQTQQEAVTSAVTSTTDAVVASGNQIASAIAASTEAITDALADVAGRLDSIESSNRLAAAAP